MHVNLIIILKRKDIQFSGVIDEKIEWDKDNDQYIDYAANDTALYKNRINWGSWNMYTISKTKIERNDDY